MDPSRLIYGKFGQKLSTSEFVPPLYPHYSGPAASCLSYIGPMLQASKFTCLPGTHSHAAFKVSVFLSKKSVNPKLIHMVMFRGTNLWPLRHHV